MRIAPKNQEKTKRSCLTEGVLQVLLPHQLEVFLNGLGRQRVLSEDEVLVLAAAIHLGHHQIREEVLPIEKNKGMEELEQLETFCEQRSGNISGSSSLRVATV